MKQPPNLFMSILKEMRKNQMWTEFSGNIKINLTNNKWAQVDYKNRESKT